MGPEHFSVYDRDFSYGFLPTIIAGLFAMFFLHHGFASRYKFPISLLPRNHGKFVAEKTY
jgi:hypothetical protein